MKTNSNSSEKNVSPARIAEIKSYYSLFKNNENHLQVIVEECLLVTAILLFIGNCIQWFMA